MEESIEEELEQFKQLQMQSEEETLSENCDDADEIRNEFQKSG